MHLGLLDGPFVPHSLISTRENPVPLLKYQMASRLKILMSSRSKKGTQIYFSFLSKVPANKPPPRFPNWSLGRGRPVYRAFCISLKNLIFRGSPVKESSLKVFLMKSLAERCATTRAILYSSVKVPGIRTPSPHTRFPSDGEWPSWREMSVSGDFLNIYSRVPSEGAPPEDPFTEPLQTEMLHPQSLFIQLSKSPVD